MLFLRVESLLFKKWFIFSRDDIRC